MNSTELKWVATFPTHRCKPALRISIPLLSLPFHFQLFRSIDSVYLLIAIAITRQPSIRPPICLCLAKLRTNSIRIGRYLTRASHLILTRGGATTAAELLFQWGRSGLFYYCASTSPYHSQVMPHSSLLARSDDSDCSAILSL